MLASFLRSLRYHGKDSDMELFARQLSEQLLELAKNPLIDGMLVESVDFVNLISSDSKTYQLKHKRGVAARGVMVIECRPKDGGNLDPTAYPTHCPANDTKDIAFLAMTPYMATNFLWTLWVW